MMMMKIIIALTWPFLNLGAPNFAQQQIQILPRDGDEDYKNHDDDDHNDDDDNDDDYSCNSANFEASSSQDLQILNGSRSR